LSGKTLFLYSEDFEAAKSLADRFAVLSPFEEPFNVCLGNKTRQQPVIVVLKQLDRHETPLYDLDQGTFLNPVCPPDSVLNEIRKSQDESEAVTIACVSNDVQRIYARFQIKLGELNARGEMDDTERRLAMKSVKFADSDLPLSEYWTLLLDRSKQGDLDE
jgi:hypothetical protein